jgi:delta 1-pyrroline-5-carboxylate dehydrogenase
MIQAASATTPPRQRRTSRKVWRLSFDGATERARILHRAADLIVERVDAIADVLTREQGKPIPDAIKEIRFGVEVIRYYAEEGRRIGGSIRASVRSDVRSLVLTTPVGVVGAITPWNYPVGLACNPPLWRRPRRSHPVGERMSKHGVRAGYVSALLGAFQSFGERRLR